MPIRYRHFPDQDLSPDAATTEGEVKDLAELEALVLLGSVGPRDEVALDGKRFKPATKIPELRQPLDERYGEQAGPLGKVLLLAGAALAALIAIGVLASFASSLLKLAFVVALLVGAVWLWRKVSSYRRRSSKSLKP